jgi:hypothetical protein
MCEDKIHSKSSEGNIDLWKGKLTIIQAEMQRKEHHTRKNEQFIG